MDTVLQSKGSGYKDEADDRDCPRRSVLQRAKGVVSGRHGYLYAGNRISMDNSSYKLGHNYIHKLMNRRSYNRKHPLDGGRGGPHLLYVWVGKHAKVFLACSLNLPMPGKFIFTVKTKLSLVRYVPYECISPLARQVFGNGKQIQQVHQFGGLHSHWFSFLWKYFRFGRGLILMSSHNFQNEQKCL